MSRNRLNSVANAARVIKAFTASRPQWGVGELAEHLAMSTSSTHRILATLADEGLLEQDTDSNKYRLGLSVFDLLAASPARRTLHEASLVAMSELRARTGETVQIGVLDGRDVVYVERLQSPDTLGVFRELGRRLDAHATSTGKVLLAFAPKRDRDRLLKGWTLRSVTDHTLTERAELERELERIRRVGYGENRQESELGVVSIAAPIRDRSNKTVAAMSIVGPVARMDAQRSPYIEAMQVLARSVSTQLGWTPRTKP